MTLHYGENDIGVDYAWDISDSECRDAIEDLLCLYSREKLISLIIEELDVQSELEEYFYDDLKRYYEQRIISELEDWGY